MATLRELMNYKLMRQYDEAKQPVLVRFKGYLVPKEGARRPIESVEQIRLWNCLLESTDIKSSKCPALSSPQKLERLLLVSEEQRRIKARLAAEDERQRRYRARRIESGGRLASIGDLQEYKARMRNHTDRNAASPAIRLELKKLKATCDRQVAAEIRQRRDERLVAAAGKGDLAKVRQLLRTGANPCATDANGTPVEMVAVSVGETQIARLVRSFMSPIDKFMMELAERAGKLGSQLGAQSA